MVACTSDRERRLWLWTAAVIIAIFTTIGLAGTLGDELPDRELLDTTFFIAFVLLVVAVVIRALRLHRGRGEVFVIAATAIVYLMMFLRMASPLERSHLIEYGVVALFIFEALAERTNNGSTVRRPALTAIALAAFIGVIDECAQLIVASRVFDPIDMGVNALAAVVAVGATVALGRARQSLERATSS